MFKMVTFEGNLIQLSQGGTMACWVCILTILRHHCKGAFTYAEKCQIGQSFTAVEGAGKGWLGPGVASFRGTALTGTRQCNQRGTSKPQEVTPQS